MQYAMFKIMHQNVNVYREWMEIHTKNATKWKVTYFLQNLSCNYD